ncbi:hypothetical protein H5P28_11575 [Ruficoccus amylovorans]|uniref:Uncharacterized protein n=1 Tax=Ruficoccus amylovorans TaxID=1804625 RepID=A0A842HH76_9BACT|nr:hypothetical protein [Ruficoccus amylovorans]MBC2594897.1 hypothetical protein [Ruficoccus amylovorans]
MSDDNNKPDLRLRAEVAKIDGWEHLGKRHGWKGLTGTKNRGHRALVPAYELDRNAIVEAIGRWTKDNPSRFDAFATALVGRNLTTSQADVSEWISLFIMATARELCLALVAADKATKGGNHV